MARRNKKREEEPENHERWLISYADFITLLFAFFVVMYSVSSVNEGKYKVLSDSLVSAFERQKGTETPIDLGGSGIIKKVETGQHASIEAIRKEVEPDDGIRQISKNIARSMHREVVDETAIIRRTERGLEVEIKTSAMFNSGAAQINGDARAVFEELASNLKDIDNSIRVEGFTDNIPISNVKFPSNWELSSARAASVVKILAENGVDPERLSATGYGAQKPIANNETEEGRRQNRRVVVLVEPKKKAP